MELKPIMSKEFVIDHDAIEENVKNRKLAEKFIADESSLFRIYSYKAIELRHEIVDQSNITETALAIIRFEK